MAVQWSVKKIWGVIMALKSVENICAVMQTNYVTIGHFRN